MVIDSATFYLLHKQRNSELTYQLNTRHDYIDLMCIYIKLYNKLQTRHVDKRRTRKTYIRDACINIFEIYTKCIRIMQPE